MILDAKKVASPISIKYNYYKGKIITTDFK